MSDAVTDERREVDVAADRLGSVALGLALLTAGIHLGWGIPRFVNYVSVGVMPDPRPLLFVLSGHAILVGVTLVGLGVVDARRTYLPGVALMLAHIAGYVAWHTVYDHGLVDDGGHAAVVTHVDGVLVVVVDHLLNAPLALVSKVAEAALIGVLGWLYLSARR